jgi:serine/threonine-protein kinase
MDDQTKAESQFSRLSSIALMIAILMVAGILSALTAMRFAIRGREVNVPQLVGKTEEEARQLLQENGLLLRVSGPGRFSNDIPEGQILDQNPPTGTRLKTNRNVKVLLSLGDRRFAVPDLVGTSLRTAQLSLEQRRFTLGNTLYAHTNGDPSTVAYQSPKPGAQAGADPSVNILVSLGPTEQYYIMPDLIGKPAELVASRARSEGFRIGNLNYRSYPGVEPGIVIQQKPQAGYRLSKNDVVILDVSQ